jgi:hypothetical protein
LQFRSFQQVLSTYITIGYHIDEVRYVKSCNCVDGLNYSSLFQPTGRGSPLVRL